ncbi:odorant receptor 330 [Tribolium castaneum]|uniref:Odorant receptor n=1 Tax=Tribolium castaneum TaxID=7070 RepID=D6WJL0_TRICA|nr:odorant receptor 330 [Tribolium castaneum]
MNYKKQFAKDDRLKTLKLMASDVFQSKTVKIILTVVFLVHFIANSLTIYFVLYVFETKLFINYASVFFSEFYPMLAILTIIFKGDVVQNLTDEITFWTIDSASKNLQHEIKLKIKFLTAFVIINSFTVVMGSFSYVQQLSDDVNLFLAIRLIRDYFPNYSTILEFFYRMTYPICGYLMAVHAYQCLYYTQHINFQLQMFTEVITELNNSKTSSLLENHLFYNRTYQTNTEQRLKFCIKRSQEFIKICVTKNKEIGSLIPGFAICGLFLGIGITFFLSTGTFTTEYYLRMGVTSICGATTFSALIWSAQTTETMTSDLVMVINEVNWYNFNQTNKKLYLTFLMNTMKERKIKFTENYSVNYQLGLAIVRGIYSVISVVASKRQH